MGTWGRWSRGTCEAKKSVGVKVRKKMRAWLLEALCVLQQEQRTGCGRGESEGKARGSRDQTVKDHYLSSQGIGSLLGRPWGVMAELCEGGTDAGEGWCRAAVILKCWGRDKAEWRHWRGELWRRRLDQTKRLRGRQGWWVWNGLGWCQGLRILLPTPQVPSGGLTVFWSVTSPLQIWGQYGWPLLPMACSSHPGWAEATLLLPLPEGCPRKSGHHSLSAHCFPSGRALAPWGPGGWVERKRPAKLSWEFHDSFHQFTALKMRWLPPLLDSWLMNISWVFAE